MDIDELISVDRDTNDDGSLDTTYYYHRDGLGSVTAMTDSGGSVVKGYVYDSFGNIKGETGTVENRYTFTSREKEEVAGLYYYRARFYDSNAGRFISEDPSHYPQAKGDNIPYLLPSLLRIPQELNNYSYVRNNSVNLTDPTGLCGCKCTVGCFRVFFAPSIYVCVKYLCDTGSKLDGYEPLGFFSIPYYGKGLGHLKFPCEDFKYSPTPLYPPPT